MTQADLNEAAKLQKRQQYEEEHVIQKCAQQRAELEKRKRLVESDINYRSRFQRPERHMGCRERKTKATSTTKSLVGSTDCRKKKANDSLLQADKALQESIACREKRLEDSEYRT
ncbi:hypothetical protein EVAR_101426_1 [Eumeta japonica]|uniref:Uncharacterized protein n=1 Tax=Eumeta variegata TaxID=151549 RepID=A0A4C1SHB9_EUMVA|nr:hypothetical protein EVAR_101426_1 [Eumeta japonica]